MTEHLHFIRHIADQTGSIPIHLDNESIKGLRNLHKLVHNEDVEHDFSKLNTLFAQPNIAIHLKNQIEKKKANGGVINDYINTLKHNGSGENSELSLVPNELIKFLDDSYSLGTTNPHTGYKEYHLGNMFDGLNNTFKPIKDSMRASLQTFHIPTQTLTSIHKDQPREGHSLGDMIGFPTLSGIGNAAYNTGSNIYNSLPSFSDTAYGIGNAAYNTASTIGNTAYNALPTLRNTASETVNVPTSQPGIIQSAMRGIARPIGSVIGGMGGQLVGQRVGSNLVSGIPFIGPIVAPVAASVTGNMGYNVGANRGKNKGTELADRFYNYLSGNKTSNPTLTSNSSPFSKLGNAAYNVASTIGNTAYRIGKNLGNAAYNTGKSVYNNIPAFSKFGTKSNISSNNINNIQPDNDGDIFYDARSE
jgi:hypothetical protein